MGKTGTNVVITNRNPGFLANSGDFCMAQRISGEWRAGQASAAGVGVQGPVIRVNTPGQILYTVKAGDLAVLVDTDSTGGSVTVATPGSTDGHLVMVCNTGTIA